MKSHLTARMHGVNFLSIDRFLVENLEALRKPS
jgi:hypothetical protein